MINLTHQGLCILPLHLLLLALLLHLPHSHRLLVLVRYSQPNPEIEKFQFEGSRLLLELLGSQ
jgi:hypothetical protein